MSNKTPELKPTGICSFATSLPLRMSAALLVLDMPCYASGLIYIYNKAHFKMSTPPVSFDGLLCLNAEVVRSFLTRRSLFSCC